MINYYVLNLLLYILTKEIALIYEGFAKKD